LTKHLINGNIRIKKRIYIYLSICFYNTETKYINQDERDKTITHGRTRAQYFICRSDKFSKHVDWLQDREFLETRKLLYSAANQHA